MSSHYTVLFENYSCPSRNLPLKWTLTVLLPCSQASSDFCSSVCVQCNTRKWKSSIKTKRPGNTHRVSLSKMDVEWEGPIFKYVWMIRCFAFTVGSLPPYVHLASTSSFTWWMSTGFASFSLLFHFHVYTERKPTKSGEGSLETVFVNWFYLSLLLLWQAVWLCIKSCTSYAKRHLVKVPLCYDFLSSTIISSVFTACDFNKNKDGYLSVHLHSHFISWTKLHVASNNHRKERILKSREAYLSGTVADPGG